MKQFILILVSVTLLVSCAKTDTPPNTPTVVADWYLEYHGSDNDHNNAITADEIVDYRNSFLHFNVHPDGTGVFASTSIFNKDIPFTWSLNQDQIQLAFNPQPYVYFDTSSYYIDSLTVNTMYLRHTYKGILEVDIFMR